MNKQLKLYNMKQEDVNECIDLFIDTFSSEPWNDIYESREQVQVFILNHMNNNYFVGYIVKIDAKIVGLSLGFQKPWINGMEYYIDQFCVDCKNQGKGIGSQFIKLIEEDIEKLGMNAIILNTETGYPSENFYKKNGFEELEGYIILAK